MAGEVVQFGQRAVREEGAGVGYGLRRFFNDCLLLVVGVRPRELVVRTIPGIAIIAFQPATNDPRPGVMSRCQGAKAVPVSAG